MPKVNWSCFLLVQRIFGKGEFYRMKNFCKRKVCHVILVVKIQVYLGCSLVTLPQHGVLGLDITLYHRTLIEDEPILLEEITFRHIERRWIIGRTKGKFEITSCLTNIWKIFSFNFIEHWKKATFHAELFLWNYI